MNPRAFLRRHAGSALLALAAVLAVALPLLLDRAAVLDRGEDWRFRWPWALLGLLVPATLLVLGLRTSPRLLPRWRYPLAPLARDIRPSLRTRLRRLPAACRAAALGLLVIALARPQGSHERFRTSSEGIDIVVALDMSGSMQEPDMFPNRFEVEKKVVREFVAQRENDRIGLVVFGSEAYPLAPLTADRALLDRMLDDLTLDQMPETMQNTAIGDALASSLARLEGSDAASRVVILLTDGMDNESDIDPMDAAGSAHRGGVRVYTILLGVQGAAVAAQGVDLQGNPVFGGTAQQFPVDPELLRRIAGTTDGAFFEAAQPEQLRQAFHRILDDLRKTQRVSRIDLADERFPRFLWLAALFLALELLLRQAVLREVA